jgi:amino acid adenylation domain-containing protein
METFGTRFRATPQQEWIWRQAAEDRTSLWSVRSVALPTVNHLRLADAFAELQSQYEILRSSVECADTGQVAQSVAAKPRSSFAVVEGEASPSEAELVSREGLPDPLECASVLTLYRTQSGDYLRVATSRSLLDSVSSDLLISKLHERYATEEPGANGNVLQYADYASWAHEQVQVGSGRPGADAQVPDARLPLPGGRGARQVASFEVPAELIAALEPDDTARGVGLEAWFFTVFSILVRRLTSQDVFAINTFVSGRTEEELRENLGLFEMPVRIEPSCASSASFAGAARTNAQRLSAANAQSYAMFDPTTETAGVSYAFRRIPDAGSNGGSWVINSEVDPLVGCELGLRVSQSARGIRTSWTYDTRKLSASVVQAINDCFLCLARGALGEAESRIDSLRLLDSIDGPADRFVLRGPEAPAASARLIDAIFDRRHENDVALALSGRTATYAELNLWSARLARLLVERHGVAEGDCVALMMGRSIEWVVAALACMRLGACYAPIEVEAPPLRIRGIVERIKPKLLIAGDAVKESTVSILQLDSAGWKELTEQRTGAVELPVVAFRSDRAAYLLHTSGSSGTPKGVLVSEGSLLNYVSWAAKHYNVQDIDASIVHTSLAVDLTVTSLWVPLFAGRRVEILEQQGSVPALLRIISEDRRWLVKLTPTHLRGLAQCCRLLGMPVAPRRGVLVIGGEQLNQSDLEPWTPRPPELRIFNEYGPTETTVGSTCGEVPEGQEGPVSVGDPIDNTLAWSVDADGQLLPFGLPGELIVGGAGVALGYCLREGPGGAVGPEHARFFRDERSKSRAYHTGDRVRIQADGTIDYLGRIDDQIKLRGFRIEPREVEDVLIGSGMLEQAVVTKVNHERQGENIVAFCVVRAGHSFDAEALRAHARQYLPGYMVPGAFVKVDQIPMTAGGKRNLTALLARNPVRAITHAQYSPPRSHVEQVLASVWSYALGVERVGLDDDYFALGGDSLRSVQITALAEKRHVRFSVVMLHRHPTVRTLAAHIAEQREPEQQVHLTKPFELLTAQDRAKLPEDVVDAYPLNLLQEGMIYHREFRPKSAVYHAICSYTIEAPFDRSLMERAVSEIIDRHPLLRTSFDLTSYSRPLQLVHAPRGGNLGFHDVANLPSPLQQMEVDRWMDREKVLGFEIEEYPLIRYMVHRLGDDRFQLSYSFHHEIIDGWSDAWMVTELMNQYMALVNGEPSEVTAPTSTFRDSIFLEQQALANKDFEAFWHQYLADVSVMKLPTYRAAKADKGEREIVKFEVPISDELSGQVQALARNLAVPLKTVLLAAHMRVMSKIGGVDDVMTYIVSNGRPENRDGHAVIGLFVNSLAFRMHLTGGSWADLVYGVLETEQRTLPYRRFPMAELKRQHGSEPLSETLFFFNNYHVAESLQHWKNLRLAGLKVYAESTFPYCVNAFVEPFVGKLHMRIEYDRLQYTAAVMDDLSSLYGAVLRGMVKDIHARYEGIDLLTPEKNRSLVDAAQGPERARQPQCTVLDLIAAAAKKNPQHPAIRCGDRVLSYAQLTRDSDHVARFLAARLQPGDVVALRMERGPDAIIAMLGTLKAGAVYVPLDGSTPPERLESILSQCNVKQLISDFEGDANLRVPCVTYAEASAEGASSAPGLRPVMQGGAYIIFTSGSTGAPKGIECEHAGLLNSTLARTEYYGNSPASFLMLSPHTFDSSVAGIYWTLCTGGTLVLPAQGSQVDPLDICRTIVRSTVSHVLCIPSLYAAILDEIESLAELGNTDSAPALTTCIVAGEACPADLQARHHRLLPRATLFNEYGPTEATVWSTVHRCQEDAKRATLSIGRPIANTAAYVLDSKLQPALPGVSGELWLGGAGIAVGYVGHSALTAERFVPDPFSVKPGARLYRTGDLCRMSTDGTLEFLGRTDGMIKVQGFRVELAEIERVLERHESVKRAVVHAQLLDRQGTQLVAYLVPAASAVDTEQVREFARRSLPKYMIPSQFVVIQSVPVKSSGKVDYSALPAPQLTQSERTQPRTSTEKLVHGIWQSVLGTPELGIHDDFFELGGESLRALRIIARVRRAFGLGVPLGMMMSTTPTISGMAEFLDQQLRDGVRPVAS